MLPIIRLEGSLFEQGLTHGTKLKDRIAHNLEVYFERFTTEGNISEPEVLNRAGQYLSVIESECPDYFESLRGVSEGSGFDIDRLAALNVRYEILYHQFTQYAMTDGCTAFAIAPERSANGNTWIGENWDWIPEVKGALLHISEGDTEIACFTEAGIVGGKIGINSHGLGLAINGMISTDDNWAHLQVPFHVRCYEILRQCDVASARAVISERMRSCSANYLIAHANGEIVNIESAPTRTRELLPEDGFVAHTNHFVDADELGITEPPSEKRPYSVSRLARSNELLTGDDSISQEFIRAVLADQQGFPYSICRHTDVEDPIRGHYQTVTSVMMDLNERAIWITDGPPDESDYREFRLNN